MKIKNHSWLIIIACAALLLTGCDTGSNDAPVINANDAASSPTDTSSYQLSDQDSNQEADQSNDQQSYVEVVPTNDIQVVDNHPAENNEPVEAQPVEHNSHVNHFKKIKHHEHARYIHHAAMDNDADDATTLQYHDTLYHARKDAENNTKNVKKDEVSLQQSGWLWPAKGEIISIFSTNHSGIEIQGVVGEPVVAVEAGTVIYSQDNVNQYGNMIIIEHGNHLMTAYAYNQALLVHPGDKVVAGQKIATMGKNPENKACVYFEVRRNGKPVNPETYLSKTS